MEIFGSVLGLIAALAAIIKLLLNAYFKQSKELESIKKSYVFKAIEDLEDMLKEHKKELKILSEKVENAVKTSMNTDRKLQDLTDSLNNYVVIGERKISLLETKLISLGKDVYMLKDKRNAGS